MTREERKERIINRLKARIEKHTSLSNSAYTRCRDIGSCIPMGQPILVGHHSERRHRRDIERMNNLMQKSVENGKIAETLESRIDTAGRSISRKDDDAITLYQEKLKSREKNHALMKNANKILKSKKSGIEKRAELALLGLGEKEVHEIINPDFAGRIGYSFHLVNSSSEIRRTKAKIEQLTRERARPEIQETINGCTIRENSEHQGIEISFPGKPSEDVIRRLKNAGFRWAFRAKVWYRNRRDDYTLQIARDLAAYDNDKAAV